MPTRMSKEDRREQLLSVAMEMIREQGTDALTLNTLAEQAGVTKPVTYNHFSSREGLLEQLYSNLDARLVTSIRQTMQHSGQSLEQLAEIVCSAYIDCMANVGSEYEAIVAALKSYQGNADLAQRIRRFFTHAYADLFSPYTTPAEPDLEVRFIALHGAIEETGKAVINGDISRSQAVTTLTRMIVSILQHRPTRA